MRMSKLGEKERAHSLQNFPSEDLDTSSSSPPGWVTQASGPSDTVCLVLAPQLCLNVLLLTFNARTSQQLKQGLYADKFFFEDRKRRGHSPPGVQVWQDALENRELVPGLAVGQGGLREQRQPSLLGNFCLWVRVAWAGISWRSAPGGAKRIILTLVQTIKETLLRTIARLWEQRGGTRSNSEDSEDSWAFPAAEERGYLWIENRKEGTSMRAGDGSCTR